MKVADAFDPDAVVVLDHERLFNELRKDLPNIVKVQSVLLVESIT
jgi:hypothetical protein